MRKLLRGTERGRGVEFLECCGKVCDERCRREGARQELRRRLPAVPLRVA